MHNNLFHVLAPVDAESIMNLILNQKIRVNMALIVAAGLPYTGKSTLVRKIINAKGIQPNILLTFTVALLCCMNTHKFGADNSYICGDTAVFVTGLYTWNAITKMEIIMRAICDRNVSLQTTIVPREKTFTQL